MEAKDFLLAFYADHKANGSNISTTAEKHGITNTDAYTMVKIAKRLAGE